MKILFSIISFLLLSAVPVFSQGTEETAVKAALAEAGAASGAKSWAEVAKTYWILDNSTIVYSSFEDGTLIELHAEQMQSSTALPADAPATVQQSNQQIVVSNNIASVTFDQTRTGADGKKTYTHEIALLEKVDGTWKIHLSTTHRYTP